MNCSAFSESKKATAPVLACPTYLQAITRNNDEICLIFDQQERTEPKPDLSQVSQDISNLTLDLTGNPLEVNLNCDVEAIVESDAHLWTEEENKHFPLELKIARREINNTLNSDHCNRYVYAICKATMKNRQVLLGASKFNDVFNRVQVFVNGVYVLSDEKMDMEVLKAEHCKDSEIDEYCLDINTLVIATFMISGQRRTHTNVQLTSGHSGSIFVELSWTKPQFNIPDYGKSIRMDAQVVVGHQASQLNILWEELTLLESLVTKLSMKSNNFENTALYGNARDSFEISAAVCELLDQCKVMRPRLLKLDFKIFPEDEFLDRLWILLNDCASVDDLRNCFHDLFKELVEIDASVQLNIPSHNTSCIAQIIREIAAGKLAILTLSHSKSLECLIELGIEKVKSDYFHILSIYDCLNKAESAQLWKSWTNNGSSVLPVDLKRRTMVSDVENSEWLTKLNALLTLHTACDLLVFAKMSKCLPPVLIHKIRGLLLGDSCRLDAFSGIRGYLYEISVEIQPDDLQDVKLDTAVAWNVRFKSTIDSSSVTTIFNLNTMRILPPVIFDFYEIPDARAQDTVYYVTKLVEYSERL